MTGQAPGGLEGSDGVTDVIQQLLELSEQVSGEADQPQPPEPAIAMETAINQDILFFLPCVFLCVDRLVCDDPAFFASEYHSV